MSGLQNPIFGSNFMGFWVFGIPIFGVQLYGISGLQNPHFGDLWDVGDLWDFEASEYHFLVKIYGISGLRNPIFGSNFMGFGSSESYFWVQLYGISGLQNPIFGSNFMGFRVFGIPTLGIYGSLEIYGILRLRNIIFWSKFMGFRVFGIPFSAQTLWDFGSSESPFLGSNFTGFGVFLGWDLGSFLLTRLFGLGGVILVAVLLLFLIVLLGGVEGLILHLRLRLPHLRLAALKRPQNDPKFDPKRP